MVYPQYTNNGVYEGKLGSALLRNFALGQAHEKRINSF